MIKQSVNIMIIYKNLNIKRLPYLQTDSRLIQIYSELLEYSRAIVVVLNVVFTILINF